MNVITIKRATKYQPEKNVSFPLESKSVSKSFYGRLNPLTHSNTLCFVELLFLQFLIFIAAKGKCDTNRNLIESKPKKKAVCIQFASPTMAHNVKRF